MAAKPPGPVGGKMCCFAGPLKSVGETKIFARRVAPDRQALVYSMRFAAAADVAMILPLPVAAGCGEDAVGFVDLSGYPGFFADLGALFPRPQVSRGGPVPRLAPATLRVVEVGAFEASFVPGLRDFDRIDPRFRLDDRVWQALPQYADHGFVVFALRGGAGEAHRAHPMAFTFPTRHAERLFFPTVHVHDGEVHPFADFDHVLYAQTAPGLAPEEVTTALESSPGLWARLTGRPAAPRPHVRGWGCSMQPAGSSVAVELSCGLVDADAPVHCVELEGALANDDVVVLERPAP